MSFRIPDNSKMSNSNLKTMLLFPNVYYKYDLKPLISAGYIDNNETITEKGKIKLEELKKEIKE